jgi:hypothetical protein
VSLTVTVNVQMFVLPLLSQTVFVTVVVPTGKAKPLARELVRFVTAQLSEAVTLKVTLLVQAPEAVFTVRFAGQVIVGFCVSFTVTVKVQIFVLPLQSVAVLVTVVVPTGKAKPLAELLVTVTVPAQLSVAVTVKVTLLVHWPNEFVTLMFAGQVMVGAVVSTTLIVCVAEAETPHGFFAVQMRVMVLVLVQEPFTVESL